MAKLPVIDIVGIMDRTFGDDGLLPDRFDGPLVRQMLVSISAQEADLRHRWQVVDLKRPNVMGPARGPWQHEKGTRESRGGVTGVFLHPASAPWLKHACERARVPFDPAVIWGELHRNDTLACAVARCQLLTDPRPLPKLGAVWEAWNCYNRNWRPGKPHPDDWPENYARAAQILG